MIIINYYILLRIVQRLYCSAWYQSHKTQKKLNNRKYDFSYSNLNFLVKRKILICFKSAFVYHCKIIITSMQVFIGLFLCRYLFCIVFCSDFIRCEFTDDLCEYQTRTTDELSRFLWKRANSEQLIAENVPGPAG